MTAGQRSAPLIVGIAGGSAAGKSVFAQRLIEELGAEQAVVISQDSYYHDRSHLEPHQRAKCNFDHPDAVDFGLLAAHLDALGKGDNIHVPHYDFATHCRTTAACLLHPRPVVLVEGVLILASSLIRERLDLTFFLDVPADVRLIRRLRRDVAERGRSPESVMEQYLTTVRPMHEKFVEPSKQFADLIAPFGGEDPWLLDEALPSIRALLGSWTRRE